MGQQQLLLLVLGIVIVGLAVVVGIQAFGENQKKANADALVNDGVRIAADTQVWALKPTAFGGGCQTSAVETSTRSSRSCGSSGPAGNHSRSDQRQRARARSVSRSSEPVPPTAT